MRFPQKDTLPAWRKVYDHLKTMNYGDTLSHADLKNLLEQYKNWRGPLYKAVKYLERNDQKTLDVVRNNGYVVVQPKEHIGLGQKRVVRGRRQMVKGKRTLEATNVLLLTDRERIELSETQSRLARILHAVNKRSATTAEEHTTKEVVAINLVDIDSRLKRIEDAIKKKKKASTSG